MCSVASVMSNSLQPYGLQRALQVPLSIAILQASLWGGLPCPPPGDLPYPGIKLESVMSPALTAGFFTINATWEAFNTW